jgi:protein TonB
MMLAYAANRPLAGKRQSSPQALLLIVSAHVALLAAVMSAKIESVPRIDRPIQVSLDPLPKPPPPNQPQPKQPQQPEYQWVDHVRPQVPTARPDLVPLDTSGTSTDPVLIGGGSTSVVSVLPPPSVTAPIHHDARLLTPLSELKPPYPASKLASEEEATLRLRLTMDEHGRVVAVDPVGSADREFLEAARRYILAHWHYEPATDDGRATTSATVVSLRFQLDG